MSVTANIIAGNFPYGNPGSLGEPLGLWVGTATVVGDASGGFVSVTFEPQNPTTTPTLADQRREYVYFIDGVRITSSVTGNFTIIIFMHMARSNSALVTPFTHTRTLPDLADGVGTFRPNGSLMEERMTRTPIFWDTQELATGGNGLVQLIAENNVLVANYRFEAYGRYYQRGVLSNRAFGRLVSPPAMSQFEG